MSDETTTTYDEIIGTTLVLVDGCKEGSDEMALVADDGRRFVFHYEPDCCASCSIEDVTGDPEDLVGSPILMAEEVTNYDAPAPENAESYTWTFYKFATAKGYVTVRWLGESNGYYSESVTFTECRPGETVEGAQRREWSEKWGRR